MASATDSVPPDVNTISSGWAPSAPATVSRDSSSIERAARPGAWMQQRIAERVEGGRRDAARASGSSGVAEAPSR